MAYDLPETIADTMGLGEAPMAMVPDLDYRGFEPVVSTVKRCGAREDLRVRFHELHRNICMTGTYGIESGTKRVHVHRLGKRPFGIHLHELW